MGLFVLINLNDDYLLLELPAELEQEWNQHFLALIHLAHTSFHKQTWQYVVDFWTIRLESLKLNNPSLIGNETAQPPSEAQEFIQVDPTTSNSTNSNSLRMLLSINNIVCEGISWIVDAFPATAEQNDQNPTVLTQEPAEPIEENDQLALALETR